MITLTLSLGDLQHYLIEILFLLTFLAIRRTTANRCERRIAPVRQRFQAIHDSQWFVPYDQKLKKHDFFFILKIRNFCLKICVYSFFGNSSLFCSKITFFYFLIIGERRLTIRLELNFFFVLNGRNSSILSKTHLKIIQYYICLFKKYIHIK
jgi:hypothetical protein